MYSKFSFKHFLTHNILIKKFPLRLFGAYTFKKTISSFMVQNIVGTFFYVIFCKTIFKDTATQKCVKIFSSIFKAKILF